MTPSESRELELLREFVEEVGKLEIEKWDGHCPNGHEVSKNEDVSCRYCLECCSKKNRHDQWRSTRNALVADLEEKLKGVQPE